MSKLKRMSTCHPDQLYYAKGLCEVCYKASRFTLTPPKKKTRRTYNIKCFHNNEKHYSGGLCIACYRAKKYDKARKARQYYQQHRQELIQKAIAYRKAHPDKKWKQPYIYKLLNRIRSRAKTRGIPFNLSIRDIHVPDVCPILGLPLVEKVREGGPSDCSPSLDRIDNSKGYVKGNVIVISQRANTIKGDATIEELQKIAAFYWSLQQT